MKRTILIALVVTLPLALCVPVLQAETPGPRAAMGASQMSESGPMVMGGTGATAGPNYRNQAIVPMPGVRQEEELAELPAARTLRVPDLRPISGPPAAKR